MLPYEFEIFMVKRPTYFVEKPILTRSRGTFMRPKPMQCMTKKATLRNENPNRH